MMEIATANKFDAILFLYRVSFFVGRAYFFADTTASSSLV